MANVLVAGGSGLVGKCLCEHLTKAGHNVTILSRSKNGDKNSVYWNPEIGELDEKSLPQTDVLINLAGNGIADKRWTTERKAAIINSRVDSNKLLHSIISRGLISPHTFISASAVGFYGDRQDEIVDETAPSAQKGFLTESVLAWENSIHLLDQPQMRTVVLRIGVVFTMKGGALPKFVQPTQFMVLPSLGSGRQYTPWIHIDDLCRMFVWAIDNSEAKGTYNAVGPNPATNSEIMVAIKKTRNIYAIPLHVPEFILRTLMGEMADVVLNSTKAIPKRMISEGFQFQHEILEVALKDIFDNKR